MMKTVDNAIYARLGDRWYEADDDPVALLRAEARLRNPWIAERIDPNARVLDVGCGAGFLSNALAATGRRVVGLDAERDALRIASSHDTSGNATYIAGDALCLPFEHDSFDVVCAMDFLEHVEDPRRVIAEAARVLRPGGKFFFHTFNRNVLSWLIVIKGVEWFVENTPHDMHVLRLFVKPTELRGMCEHAGMQVEELLGSRPKLSHALALVGRRSVPRDFAFVFTPSLLLGYTGWAVKVTPPATSRAA
jgi:2-polyprenyl-6-hydroxyphenyl methylase/3-demethylubiquinone-9 3-methyltransferase